MNLPLERAGVYVPPKNLRFSDRRGTITNRSAYGIRSASGTMDTREGNPLSSSSLRSSDAADEARETMRDVITCKKVRRIEN